MGYLEGFKEWNVYCQLIRNEEKNMKTEHTFKICPSCEYFCNSLEPDKYCSICGAELISKCPNCGGEISNPYANFCKYCGKLYPGRTKEEHNKK